MLDRGIHPVRIGEGFDRACQAAVTHLEKISDAVEFSKDNTEVSFTPVLTSVLTLAFPPVFPSVLPPLLSPGLPSVLPPVVDAGFAAGFAVGFDFGFAVRFAFGFAVGFAAGVEAVFLHVLPSVLSPFFTFALCVLCRLLRVVFPTPF